MIGASFTVTDTGADFFVPSANITSSAACRLSKCETGCQSRRKTDVCSLTLVFAGTLIALPVP